MKRVLTAVVLIPLVLVAVFRVPDWLFFILVGVVAVLAAYEYLAIVEAFDLIPFRNLVLVLAVLAFLPMPPGTALKLGAYLSATLKISTLLVWSPFAFLLLSLFRKDLRSALPSAGASFLAVPYILFPLSMLGALHILPNGKLWILYLFVVVWSGDISAFYVGSFFGRIPLAPRISPKKTWEGAVASAVASTALGTLVLMNLPGIADGLAAVKLLPSMSVLSMGTVAATVEPVPFLSALLLSLMTNIAAQLGDLVESMMKRGANIKDSGTLLPGHGGVLDRIDALLFAVPVVWYYALFHAFSLPK